MKRLLQIVLVVITAVFTGCYSLDVTKMPGQNATAGEQHIIVSNYGWYLFNTWPIISGNPQAANRASCRLFKNTVRLPLMQDKLMTYAKQHNTTVSDIQTDYRSTCMISLIPFLQNVAINVDTTFGIIWYKEIQISATLKKEETK